MIPCPNCHQSVEIEEKHLGTLFTCPHCNSVYFIDWNGQPELAVHESENETDSAASDSTNEQGNFQQIEVSSEQDVVPYFQNNEADPNINYASSQNENFSADGSIDYSDSSFDPPQNDYSSPAETPYDFSQPFDHSSLGPDSENAASTFSSADFSDVTDFANSNANIGPLSYVVIIEGIESSHLLIQLKEAMTDSRFGWDVSSLLESVGEGRLVLSGLSPAKASVLVSRIKYLPLKISWRQDVFSST